MANREKDEFDLTLDGKTWRFKMGTVATIELQEHFSEADTVARLHAEEDVRRLRAALSTYGTHQDGCKQRPCSCGFATANIPRAAQTIAPLEGILHQVFSGRMKYIAAYLWAGLKRFHPEVTLPDVMDLLDSASMEEVQQLLRDLGLSMQPAPEDAKELSQGVTKKKNPRKARPKPGAGENSISSAAASV